MIEWVQISKPQKIPGPKINLKKKSHVEFPSLINFGDMWAPSRIFALFEYPEYPYLNQANQKILAKFFHPQNNPRIKNFKPKKVLRSSPSLEIQRSPPPPLGSNNNPTLVLGPHELKHNLIVLYSHQVLCWRISLMHNDYRIKKDWWVQVVVVQSIWSYLHSCPYMYFIKIEKISPQKRLPANPEIINKNFLLIIETVIYASFSTVFRLLVKVVYLPDVNYWISTSRNNLILTFINCYAPDLHSAHNIFVINYFKNYCNLITKWSLNPDSLSFVSDRRARGKCKGKRRHKFALTPNTTFDWQLSFSLSLLLPCSLPFHPSMSRPQNKYLTSLGKVKSNLIKTLG